MGQTDASGVKRGLAEELATRWPSLPFMAFGVWTAWSSLTYSGSLWLSDNEVNGFYLSLLFVISTMMFAVVFLGAPFFARRHAGKGDVSNRAVMGFGLLAALGAFLIILAGPYWLGVSLQPISVFVVGALMTGAGTAGIGLRCATLYGGLPPRRALITAALSQLVASFIYFVVLATPTWAPIAHGPSLAHILAFTLLPVVAAWLSCIKPSHESLFEENVRQYPANSGALPAAFWRFSAFAFALALITTFIRSSMVTVSALANTVEGNNVLQLLRIAMVLVVIAWTLRSDAQGFDLGRVCSLATVLAAVVTACSAALGGTTSALSVLVYFASSIFEFFMWCLLAFIVYQKHISPLAVFGFGRGLFMLGCALGWAFGIVVMPSIEAASAQVVVSIVLAGTIIILWLALFSGKDYERLFSTVGEDELSLEDLFEIDQRLDEGTVAGQPKAERKGKFGQAVEAIAARNALSAREAEVLRCLAMGYGSERIAQTMGVKVNTVRTHTHNVYVKLDVHSREELMRLVDDEVAGQ